MSFQTIALALLYLALVFSYQPNEDTRSGGADDMLTMTTMETPPTTYSPSTSSIRILIVCFEMIVTTTAYWYLASHGLRRRKEPTVKQKIAAQSRINSNINAIIVCLLALLAFAFERRTLFDKPLHSLCSLLQINACGIFAYSVVDTVLILKTLKYSDRSWGDIVENVCYIVHHLASIYLSTVVAFFDYLPLYANIRMLSELSTPIVNLRWFYLKKGYGNRFRFNLLQSAMLAVFICCRCLPIVPFWLSLAEHTGRFQIAQMLWPGGSQATMNTTNTTRQCRAYMRVHFEMMVACCIALDILNIVWVTKIAQVVRKGWKIYLTKQNKQFDTTPDKSD